MYTLKTLQAIETVDLVKTLYRSQNRNAPFCRKLLKALSLRAVHFKPVLVDIELSLRISRLWDLARLKARFDPGLFLLKD